MCRRLQLLSVVIGILAVLALLVMTGGCAQSAAPSPTPAASVSKTSTPVISSSSPALPTSSAAPPAPAPTTSQPPPPAASQPAASPKPPAPSSSAPAAGGVQPPPAAGGAAPPPAGGAAAPAPSDGAAPAPLPAMSGKLLVTSSVVKENGILPDLYNCNGLTASTPIVPKSLPLSWTGAPAATKSFVVLITHVRGGGDEGIFFVVYNIPGTSTGLPAGIADNTVDPKIGTVGNNDKLATSYSPPCGGGTGTFKYTVIVYAVSKTLDGLKDPTAADAAAVRDAMTGSILDAGALNFNVVLP